MKDSLRNRLREYSAKGRLSFHTPGHKNKSEFLAGIEFPAGDLTELPELDVLAHAQGILGEAQNWAAQAFGADQTYFLVNGGTAGNLAMFLAIAAGKPDGGKIRVERQAHRSVFSGLTLSGLTPQYIMPIIHPDFNLPLGTRIEDYWSAPESLLAIHVTCPSYYGTAVDQEALLRQRDHTAPATPVLVDQAHGAHWQGTLFPPSAVELGADLVVHSTHKTLGSLTQSALLHCKGMRVSRRALSQALEMVQSSSPSYLLMASLEAAADQRGRTEIWEALQSEVGALVEELKRIYRVLNPEDIGSYGIEALDWSKIVVNVAPLGVTAETVVDFLRQEYAIEPELWQESTILFVLGIGNTPAEVEKLKKALKTAAERRNWRRDQKAQRKPCGEPLAFELPPLRLTPRQAWEAPRRPCLLETCRGEIAAETIVVYPPGIPLIVAGEEITEQVLERLKNSRHETNRKTIEIVGI